MVGIAANLAFGGLVKNSMGLTAISDINAKRAPMSALVARRRRPWVAVSAETPRNPVITSMSSGFTTSTFEVLTSAELAARLKVKESWVIDQSKRSKTSDPIPVFRLGKHRRYRWGSPEMDAWLDRRAGTTTRKAEPRNGGIH